MPGLAPWIGGILGIKDCARSLPVKALLALYEVKNKNKNKFDLLSLLSFD